MSNFIFALLTSTPGCPDLELVMLRPFETQSDIRLTYSDCRVSNEKVYRRF
ncbi:hypothetical protein FHS28_000505 [Roseateles terrae]|uniref:Uncharacterized protein n=1 Tax=Roseateles terrae TaxID=431060 RepID=A0ABR6GLZ8_9BURK|nr:hypothetical protein [Roseateles terrae]